MSQDKSQLFIPSKIKVGFQDRSGTYTGKLAYVIYYDNKNVLRKEKSWESWRDKKIDAVDMNNEPFDGFVLNKGVGGTRESYGWNARNEYIRVYDSRNDGFEFEISVANLLFILRECNCMKGKGLEGKFVYAWDGTELVLLPTNSEEYRNSAEYTSLQSVKTKAKDLILGATYVTKKQKNIIYLGKFDHYQLVNYDSEKDKKQFCTKKFIFYSTEDNDFVICKDLSNLSQLVSKDVIDNYADLVEKYNKSQYGSKIVGFRLEEVDNKPTDDYSCVKFFTEYDGGYLYSYYYDNKWSNYAPTIYTNKLFFIAEGNVWWKDPYKIGSNAPRINHIKKENKLIALMESGSEIDISTMTNYY